MDEIPFVFEPGKPVSAAYTDHELLEVQLRDAEQWFYFAERHRRIASLILDAIIHEYDQRDRDLETYARRGHPLPLNNQLIMMMGLALENLAKGALIPGIVGVVKANGELGGGLKTHDVRALVERLGLARPEWDGLLAACTVAVTGPDARYHARARADAPSMGGSHYSFRKLWDVFEDVFETLALELLKRSDLCVRITLPQYQSGEEELCIRECSHSEWIAWRLHSKLPDWMPVPPTPTNAWRGQIEAIRRGDVPPAEE